MESRTKFDGIEDLQYDLTKQKLGLIALQRPYRNSGNARPIKCRSNNQLVRRWSPKWRVMTWPVQANQRRFLLSNIQKIWFVFERFFWENNWFWAYYKFIARNYPILLKMSLVLVQMALMRAFWIRKYPPFQISIQHQIRRRDQKLVRLEIQLDLPRNQNRKNLKSLTTIHCVKISNFFIQKYFHKKFSIRWFSPCLYF